MRNSPPGIHAIPVRGDVPGATRIRLEDSISLRTVRLRLAYLFPRAGGSGVQHRVQHLLGLKFAGACRGHCTAAVDPVDAGTMMVVTMPASAIEAIGKSARAVLIQ